MPSISNLILHQYNDETVYATLYEDVAMLNPIDLTGATVEFLYKTSNSQNDTDSLRLPAVILDAIGGKVSVEISNELVDLAKKFFRIDVISGTKRKTAVYGSISVLDL